MPDLLVKLYDTPDPAQLISILAEERVTVRRAMSYEKQLVVDYVQRSFGQGWADECDSAFCRSPIACHIATEDAAVIGFACHDSTCLNFFGPAGVSEPARGRGIGKALLLMSLSAMRAAGYAYAIIGDAADPDFYERTVDATVIEGSTPGVYRDRLEQG